MKFIRLVILATLCSVGCSTAPSANISGTWAFNETINSSTGFTCQATGELLIAQFSDNNRFTGQRARTATCTGAPAGFSIDGAQALINAEIRGDAVTFEADFCLYEGTLTGNNQMSGTSLCPDGLGQEQFEFDGTWNASR